MLCCYFIIPKTFASESNANVLRHHTTVAAETQFHWVEAGNSHQPTLLFLAGWLQTSYAWHKVMVQLADQFHARIEKFSS